VVDVLAQDALELAAADDEQLIEALLAQGAHEALGVGVGVRRPDPRADGFRALRVPPLRRARRSARRRPCTRSRTLKSPSLPNECGQPPRATPARTP